MKKLVILSEAKDLLFRRRIRKHKQVPRCARDDTLVKVKRT
jgi:hypothetical protein